MSWTPPPNWPPPPAPGWEPPPGWQPDPSWGPAPAGWNFYPPASSPGQYGSYVPPPAATPPSPSPVMQPPTSRAAASRMTRTTGWMGRHKIWTAVIVLIVLGAIGGGVGGASSSGSNDKTDASGTPASTSDANTPEPSPTFTVPPSPKPDARYTHSCDYLLGDFSNFTSHGYRFIARATNHNTGNVGLRVRVKASWVQVGGHNVVKTKTVTLPYNRSKAVNFSVPVGQSQIDAIQAAQDAGAICHVKATIIGTFGAAH